MFRFGGSSSKDVTPKTAAEISSQAITWAETRKKLSLLVGPDDAIVFVDSGAQLSAQGKGIKGDLVLSVMHILFQPSASESVHAFRLPRKDISVAVAETALTIEQEGVSRRLVCSSSISANFFAEELTPVVASSRLPGSIASPRQKEVVGNPTLGSLQLNVLAGKNLLPMDNTGKSDPFVRATLVYKEPGKEKEREESSTTLQTKYVEQDLNPRWGEVLVWDVMEAIPTAVKIRVYDYDELGGDDLIGQCTVPVSVGMQQEPQWHELLGEKGVLHVFDNLKMSLAQSKVQKKLRIDKLIPGASKSKAAPAETSLLAELEKSKAEVDEDAPRAPPEPALGKGAGADGLQQFIQCQLTWRKSLNLIAEMYIGPRKYTGAICAFETSLGFLDETSRLLCNVPFREIMSMRWLNKTVVLETTDRLFILAGFESKSSFQKMHTIISPKFGSTDDKRALKKPERRPSVADMSGLTPFPSGTLTVFVIEGMGLVAKDRVKGQLTSSDPYVKIAVLDGAGMVRPESVQLTRVVDKSLMPVWDQHFRMTIPENATAILFTVWDKDSGPASNDDFMGQCLMSGDEFRKRVSEKGFWEGWLKLESRSGRQDRVSGKLRISLQMDPSALAEAEDASRAFGIDVFKPTRRESKTRLDFDVAPKYNTFTGTFKGEHVRLWVSDEAVALYGNQVRLRLPWISISRVRREKVEDVEGLVLKIAGGNEVYIHQPDERGVIMLERTYQRFREALAQTSRPIAGDSPQSVSFIRMHPNLTLLVHGALLGKHIKMLTLIWLLLSTFLAVNLALPGSVISRLLAAIGLISVLSWLAEHVEFGLDWESLIVESEYPLVEADFNNMLSWQNVQPRTRIAMFFFGLVFLVLSSIGTLSNVTLAFPFTACILFIISTMLNPTPGEMGHKK